MSNLKVLHIVSDYPDHTNLNYTNAVKNLLHETKKDACHEIIALRRIKMGKLSFQKYDEYFYFQVPSFPFALFHILSSFIYSLILLKEIKKHNIRFDVIHGHKLTIDGVIAYFLSRFTGAKYVLSVRADTDLKFINNKPLSRYIFRHVFKRAKHIFWVSAWAKNTINKILGYKHLNESNLPNIVTTEGHTNPCLNEGFTISKKFIFVGRLESAEKKGLLDIIEVMQFFPDVTLEIYGSSNDKINEGLLDFIQKHGVGDQVLLKGTLLKADLINSYKNYCALLMPSKNETFGMVYVEALLEGLPVLCCEKSGIDGYLTDKNYLQKVIFKDKISIKNAMQLFLQEQSIIKKDLHRDIRDGMLDVFLVSNVKKRYLSDLKNV
jgi:glycosyltransferase involved in cell wall biosynthesis